MFLARVPRRGLVRAWVCDDAGQDLVEYALLVTFFGIVMVAAWDTLAGAVSTIFGQASSGVQGLWDPPAPGAGSP